MGLIYQDIKRPETSGHKGPLFLYTVIVKKANANPPNKADGIDKRSLFLYQGRRRIIRSLNKEGTHA